MTVSKCAAACCGWSTERMYKPPFDGQVLHDVTPRLVEVRECGFFMLDATNDGRVRMSSKA